MSNATLPVGNVPQPAAPPASTRKQPRRVMFDCLRLLAAVAIVWLHTPRSQELAGTGVVGRFAVPFFVFATIFFIWQGLVDKPGQKLRPYIRSRFVRIYLPFLAWSVVYLAFKAAKSMALPNQPNDFPGIEFLWSGSFYHLWFLPFIFVVSLVVFALGKQIVERPTVEVATAILCLAAGEGVALAPSPLGGQFELAWNALPAVFWGITLAVAYHRGGAQWMQSRAATVLGLFVALCSIVWLCYQGRNSLAENLAGAGCTLVALAPESMAWLQRVGALGPLAYGIYLSHLLFIKSAEAVLNKLGIAATPLVDVGVFLLAVVGSTALAWALSRWKLTRWLVA